MVVSGFTRDSLPLHPQPVESWVLVGLAAVYTLGFSHIFSVCASLFLYPRCPFPPKPNLGFRVPFQPDVCTPGKLVFFSFSFTLFLSSLTLSHTRCTDPLWLPHGHSGPVSGTAQSSLQLQEYLSVLQAAFVSFAVLCVATNTGVAFCGCKGD